MKDFLVLTALFLLFCPLLISQSAAPANSPAAVDLSSYKHVQDLVMAYAPVVRFHPEEKYYTDKVENYLNNAYLCKGYANGHSAESWIDMVHSNHYISIPVKSADLGKAQVIIDGHTGLKKEKKPSDIYHYWLIPRVDFAREGDVQNTRIYVVINQNLKAKTLTIEYWYFYQYNGPGRYVACYPSSNCVYTQMVRSGQHEGDWEHIDVEIDITSGAVLGVYLSAHEGLPNSIEEIQFLRETHPLVYSAKYSHAFYAKPGIHSYKRLKQVKPGDPFGIGGILGTFSVDLYDQTAERGIEMDHDANASCDFELVSSNIPCVSPRIIRQPWHAFGGRWGNSELLSENMNLSAFEAIGIPTLYVHKDPSQGPYRVWEFTPAYLYVAGESGYDPSSSSFLENKQLGEYKLNPNSRPGETEYIHTTPGNTHRIKWDTNRWVLQFIAADSSVKTLNFARYSLSPPWKNVWTDNIVVSRTPYLYVDGVYGKMKLALMSDSKSRPLYHYYNYSRNKTCQISRRSDDFWEVNTFVFHPFIDSIKAFDKSEEPWLAQWPENVKVSPWQRDSGYTNLEFNPNLNINTEPKGPICAGTSVTFVASVAYPDSSIYYNSTDAFKQDENSPIYTWLLNGTPIGTSFIYSKNYITALYNPGDVISCSFRAIDENACGRLIKTQGSLVIPASNEVDSRSEVQISVNPGNSICLNKIFSASGGYTFEAKASFTTKANRIGQSGSNPEYQAYYKWFKNGNVLGDGGVYIDSNGENHYSIIPYTADSLDQFIKDGDIFHCEVTSNHCATPNVSNKIIMGVLDRSYGGVISGPKHPCPNSTVSYQISAATNVVSYQWLITGDATQITGTGDARSFIVGTGNVNIICMPQGPCGKGDTINYSVLPSNLSTTPCNTPLILSTQNGKRCPGSTEPITLSVYGDSINIGGDIFDNNNFECYKWSTGETSKTIRVTQDGTYSVIANGCPSEIITISSEIPQHPTISIQIKTPVWDTGAPWCKEDNSVRTLSASASNYSGNASVSYKWYRNGEFFKEQNAGLYLDMKAVNSFDVFKCKFLINEDCAVPVWSNEITLPEILAMANPSVSLSANPTFSIPGDTVVFSAKIVDGGANPSLGWFFDGNLISPVSSNNGSDVKWVIQDTSMHQMRCILNSNAVCMSGSSVAKSNVVSIRSMVSLIESALNADVNGDGSPDLLVLGISNSQLTIPAGRGNCVLQWIPEIGKPAKTDALLLDSRGSPTGLKFGKTVQGSDCLPGANPLAANGGLANPLLAEALKLNIYVRLKPSIGKIKINTLQGSISPILIQNLAPDPDINELMRVTNLALGNVAVQPFLKELLAALHGVNAEVGVNLD